MAASCTKHPAGVDSDSDSDVDVARHFVKLKRKLCELLNCSENQSAARQMARGKRQGKRQRGRGETGLGLDSGVGGRRYRRFNNRKIFNNILQRCGDVWQKVATDSKCRHARPATTATMMTTTTITTSLGTPTHTQTRTHMIAGTPLEPTHISCLLKFACTFGPENDCRAAAQVRLGLQVDGMARDGTYTQALCLLLNLLHRAPALT